MTFRTSQPPSRNLFATRGRKLSIVQHRPTSNPWVFAGAGAALCIGIFFHYVPWLYVYPFVWDAISATHRRRIYSHGIFQTRPVPVEFFFIPLTFALGLLLYVSPFPL